MGDLVTCGVAAEFRRYNALLIIAFCAVVGGFVAFNYRENIYGLFGNARGESLPAWGTERTAKYLLSYNYIPANFDGALFGTSVSANLDTSQIKIARVYNCSISGGNISEQHLIADQLFERRRLKLAIFVVYPYLTETYGRKSSFMDPHEYWSALGSLQILNAYRERLGLFGHRRITAFGQELNEPVGPRLTPQLIDSVATNDRAMAEYAEMVRRADADCDCVLALIPLIPREESNARHHALNIYNSQILACFGHSDLKLDLNSCAELDKLAVDHATFPDGTHYSRAAAEQISKVLNTRISRFFGSIQ